jgi:hypothetical protein
MSLGKTEILRRIGGWLDLCLDILGDLESEQSAQSINLCCNEDYESVSDSILCYEPANTRCH